MPFLRLISLFAALFLVACDRDSALRGKWEFDRPYTEARMPKPGLPKPEEKDILGQMKAGLGEMLVPMLLDKLDGATLTVTKKEMIVTTRDGIGKAEPYEIFERPNPRTWRVKGPDGKVETWSIEGDHLASAATGDVHFMTYFKRP